MYIKKRTYKSIKLECSVDESSKARKQPSPGEPLFLHETILDLNMRQVGTVKISRLGYQILPFTPPC